MTYDIPPLYYKVLSPNGVIDGELISFSTREVLVEAEKHGLRWAEIPGSRVFLLTLGNITRPFYAQVPPTTTEIGFNICLDKSATRAVLQHAGVPIAKGYHIKKNDSPEYIESVFHSLQKPLVVKPTHGNAGRSVFMNVIEREEYLRTVKDCLNFSHEPFHGAIVEEQAVGVEYRVLATKKKVLGIINRVPANVTGDGEHTISQLVQIKNTDPRRSKSLADPLCKIHIDEVVISELSKQSLDVESIPPKDAVIYLRSNSNISTGGDSIDITDRAHASVHALALQVMSAIPGIEFAGIDILTTNIEADQQDVPHMIIEVNGSPGFNIHDYPYIGKRRNVAKEFLLLMFPELEKT